LAHFFVIFSTWSVYYQEPAHKYSNITPAEGSIFWPSAKSKSK
jgi:hypothetical protein